MGQFLSQMPQFAANMGVPQAPMQRAFAPAPQNVFAPAPRAAPSNIVEFLQRQPGFNRPDAGADVFSQFGFGGQIGSPEFFDFLRSQAGAVKNDQQFRALQQLAQNALFNQFGAGAGRSVSPELKQMLQTLWNPQTGIGSSTRNIGGLTLDAFRAMQQAQPTPAQRGGAAPGPQLAPPTPFSGGAGPSMPPQIQAPQAPGALPNMNPSFAPQLQAMRGAMAGGRPAATFAGMAPPTLNPMLQAPMNPTQVMPQMQTLGQPQQRRSSQRRFGAMF